MGQTLTSAAQWTTARESGKGKLELTPVNETILNEIVTFTEGFARSNPEEAKHLFKKPLAWSTSLTPNDVSSLTDDQSEDGQKLVTIKGKTGSYTISVLTMEKAEAVLAIAADQKLAEARACLESNNDPVANMLGDRFAIVEGEDNSIYRFVEETMGASGQGQEEDNEEAKEKKMILKMLLQIKDFDERMLKKAVKDISSEVKLRPSEVDRIVNLLMEHSGDNEEKHVLEKIDWMEPYTFVYGNGCRAPSWRQMYGDISYIEVRPHDVEPLSVTASTNGYFMNGGLDKDSNQLKFDKDGEYYRDLVALLRAKSPKFDELVDKQEFFSVRAQSQTGVVVDTTADLEQEYGKDGDRDRAGDETNRSKKQQQQDDNDKNKDKKKDKQKAKKLEPSLKWKNLALEENKEKDQKDEKKPKKQKKQRRDSKMKSAGSDGESSFEESSSESEEEEEAPDRRNDTSTDLPSEYWQIQKLVKYLKAGNQTATIIALCCMRDFNLQQETCQLAIRDVGGLEVLINLLDTEEIKCKIGSLRILKEISRNVQIRRAIADLGGLQTMVKILRDPNKDLKCLAAETIANVAKFRRARRTVRQHGGIKKLVALLDCSSSLSSGGGSSSMGSQATEQERDVEVARAGALALWSCSKSTRNKLSMRKAGAIPLLAKLLKSPHENMLIPVVGTLQECATEPSYRLAIRTEGMIEDLVKNLQSENQELQMHCASAIFKCAEEKETRDLVRQYGGLDPLVKLLNNTENKELLAAATGAIWKCAISHENVVRFQELKAIDLLVNLLNDQPEEVLVNVVGALAELAQDPPNRLTIRKAGGIPPLVNLLTGTNQALLVNVTKATGQCAEEPDNMTVIDKLDGVRLLWSLLKNPNPEVQASAAWAICPCIENAKDAGEMVRSFVGGLELIVGLLNTQDKDTNKPEHREVLASVCAAIANIANDEENLAVITDHGVVPLLAKLTKINDDRLRRHLAEAIARCCNWGNNRVAFGEEDAVAPLVKYLKSNDVAVNRSTARALHQLSKDPDNCITMHDNGVVKYLMEMVGSEDEVLQEAAAGCIANIRRLALANEKARHK